MAKAATSTLVEDHHSSSLPNTTCDICKHLTKLKNRRIDVQLSIEIKINKWSKNFDERLHRRGGGFFTETM